MFKRKVYNELLEWKEKYADRSACLLEGARRVGKSTIALEFAKNEYESFIFIDFSNISTELLEVFNDISDLDIFFLRLQTVTGINLIVSKSAIIFDEVQFFPKARQAIKHLVKDGRYHYIETGSLISIKKNVREILIPSEEHKINVFPMDYEEFNWALKKSTDSIRTLVEKNAAIGDMTNRKLMRDFRIYMAIGGMPQVVSTYLQTNNLDAVDKEKRDIISLYEDDLKRIYTFQEKRVLLNEVLLEYSLDLGPEICQEINNYCNYLNFSYQSDTCGLYDNYWRCFFEMLSTCFDILVGIKNNVDDILYRQYSV